MMCCNMPAPHRVLESSHTTNNRSTSCKAIHQCFRTSDNADSRWYELGAVVLVVVVVVLNPNPVSEDCHGLEGMLVPACSVL